MTHWLVILTVFAANSGEELILDSTYCLVAMETIEARGSSLASKLDQNSEFDSREVSKVGSEVTL
ncbi:uncharacterized protein N7525_002946 [Penicillium rubens]|jgi:hypothetical protein|uniref:uncharacterized protein n=1 Tax=Penicillium rubens TaxID=1108849 RepID=UPI0023997505|nr:uncharacterized protein N7525_002946 [Penicillium rubens]KAJ5286221.1 hypothetical protein N7524_001527 [Penicillium chrysogenum]KAJ5837758.1 hypothetical protein N7525_002946 [Penicillium rubens]KAJ5865802.1 hypothetical protein N7534_000355 [Penicillium rubens]